MYYSPSRRLCNRRCFSVCLFVCLFVCLLATLCKNVRRNLHEIFSEGWQWANEELIKFGGNPDHRLDPGIVFRIRCYCEIGKA